MTNINKVADTRVANTSTVETPSNNGPLAGAKKHPSAPLEKQAEFVSAASSPLRKGAHGVKAAPLNSADKASTGNALQDKAAQREDQPVENQADSQVAVNGKKRRPTYTQPSVAKSAKTLIYSEAPKTDEQWRFRATTDLSAVPDRLNKTGLDTLKMSGSASISSAEQMAKIRQTAGDHPVVVFDLRKDPHAAIDGVSATWTMENNWANLHKTFEGAMKNEQKRIDRVNEQGTPVTLVNDLDLKNNLDNPRTITLNNPTALSEQQVVEQSGAQYVRIGVGDHLRPADQEIDRFISAVRDMPDNSWSHFHCKGGKGRTTSFMAMYDMLRNADKASKEDLIERQMAFGYGYDLTNVSNENNPERDDGMAERAELIDTFHHYAVENPNGKPLLWTQWLEQNTEAKH